MGVPHLHTHTHTHTHMLSILKIHVKKLQIDHLMGIMFNTCVHALGYPTHLHPPKSLKMQKILNIGVPHTPAPTQITKNAKNHELFKIIQFRLKI